MADDQDDGQKTEAPSQRRLQRAHDEGRVAQSREINTWFLLGATALLLMFVGPRTAHVLNLTLASFADPQRYLAHDGIIWDAVGAALAHIGEAVAIPLGILTAAALAGSLVQTGFVFATDRIGFDLSHISPVAGLGRLFSLRAVLELLKSVAKVVLVGAVAWMMLRGEVDRLSLLPTLSPEDILGETARMVLRLLFGVVAVLTILAGADYLYQRLHFLRSLRMSKREIREEVKQAEGDPLIRARLRQIRMDRTRRRMMAAVPTASVVITNPTHYAVALKYELGAAGAPKLVAKGTDLIALKIREVAEENNVPIVENPPLARALHAGVDLDREIPPEHYRAVAEIIGYVFRLKGKLRPAAAPV
jgi:flagellar biosynthetic protein FlhB